MVTTETSVVREATVEDIDRIVTMGRRFLAETEYREVMAGDPVRMAETVRDLIAGDRGLLLVLDGDEGLRGMIGVFAFEHPISGAVVASELFWWVEPETRGDGLKLLRGAERWARGVGASVLQMIAPNEKVARLYQAFGYVKVETLFQMRLT